MTRPKSISVNRTGAMKNGAAAAIMIIVLVLAFVAGYGSSTLCHVNTISKATTVTDTFAQTLILLATTSSVTCNYAICVLLLPLWEELPPCLIFGYRLCYLRSHSILITATGP